MKQLIVNADDFAYTRGVNRAILQAYRRGILTSASLLANGPAFEDAVEQARQEPGLDIGCHLNFVEGVPVSPPVRIPHLVGSGGRFHSALRLAILLCRRAVPAVELERECSAQIEKLFQRGIHPSHVDTHKHTHLHPQVASVVARIARQFEVRWIRRPFENCTPPHAEGATLRKGAVMALNCLAPRFERRMAAHGLRMPDFFTGLVLTGRLTKLALAGILGALRPGVTELMCHPGYCDGELERSPTRLKQEREVELETVADAKAREEIRRRGVILTGFAEVSPASATASKNPLLAVPAPANGE